MPPVFDEDPSVVWGGNTFGSLIVPSLKTDGADAIYGVIRADGHMSIPGM